MYVKNIRPGATFNYFEARSARIELRALGALKLASDENVPAKRADVFIFILTEN